LNKLKLLNKIENIFKYFFYLLFFMAKKPNFKYYVVRSGVKNHVFCIVKARTKKEVISKILILKLLDDLSDKEELEYLVKDGGIVIEKKNVYS